jgi:hypothetical protein
MDAAGMRVLEERPGDGAEIKCRRTYRLRLKLCLNRGGAIRWDQPIGLIDRAVVEEGASLVTDLRIDCEQPVAGLYQEIEGMRVGGWRKLKVSPHRAYGERGIPGKIPPGAAISAEIEFITERDMESTQ